MRYSHLTLIFSLIIILFTQPGSAQQFENGDLEGEASSRLPHYDLVEGWEAILVTDPLSQATTFQGNNLPIVVSQYEPASVLGLPAYPFSGETSIVGCMVEWEQFVDTVLVHSGIQQLVSGFEIGNSYQIVLHQAVNSLIYAKDSSGAWLVALDDEILDTTAISVNKNDMTQLGLNWERREVNFTATKQEHVIKFIPYDDDKSHIAHKDSLDGGLAMAIDLVSISEATSSIEQDTKQSIEFYPNPFTNIINIKTSTKISKVKDRIHLRDNFGRIVHYSKYNYNGKNWVLNVEHLKEGQYFIHVTGDGHHLDIPIIKR